MKNISFCNFFSKIHPIPALVPSDSVLCWTFMYDLQIVCAWSQRKFRDTPLIFKYALVSCMFHIVYAAEIVEEVVMLFVFVSKGLDLLALPGFLALMSCRLPSLLLFEVGSRSGHPCGMPHWDLIQSSSVTVGQCRCYGPSFFSFLPRWTRGSHRFIAVLTPVGVGAGKLWLLVTLAIEMLVDLG